MSKKHVLSDKDILHLADLAKLNLTQKEIDLYKVQFSETIQYIKNLGELNTDKILPTNSVVNLKNVTYEDGSICGTGLTIHEALQNAKKTIDNKFVVERIMK